MGAGEERPLEHENQPMNGRPRLRPFSVFVLLSMAFALGILAERSPRLFWSDSYPPPGLEKTFTPFWEAWHLVERNYVDREAIQPQRMTRGAIEGMLFSLGDPGHTTYLTGDEFKGMESVLEGRMEGIGARITVRNGQPTIVNTIAGSPARAAGLQPGDVILQVDGKPVSGLPLERLLALIRGPVGESIRMTISRKTEKKPLMLPVARARVEVPDVSWHLLPGGTIAHLAIQSFGKQADDQLKAALKEARDQGARALVLDVRGNSGGLKDQAVAVTSEFLSEGDVFIEQDAKGERKAIAVKPGGSAPDIPVCVLIDEATASSAEIFAGALQDHERGKLVGAKTFGTGTVLEPFVLSDGSAVLLAVAEWLTPKGREIWHHGIAPDIAVPQPRDALVLSPESEAGLTAQALAKSEDKQLLKAIEVLKASSSLARVPPR
jgi:carboxyl-terminal processing protease